MIFAAGLGTRMGPLTRDRPKPLLAVAGRPLLDHALALARAVRPPRVVVNTHAHAGQIADHLAGSDVVVSHEPERLETGGGLRRALPLLAGDPVFTLNPDALWAPPNPLQVLAEAWEPVTMDALLCLVPYEATRCHDGPGDFRLGPDGHLSRRGAAPSAPFVYGGAQLTRTSAVAELPDGPVSINRVWDDMLARGRLFGLVHPGPWIDVGRPEGLAAAEAFVAAEAR
jgi:MurNAc alpha-1-phosphate uridylyltransferase